MWGLVRDFTAGVIPSIGTQEGSTLKPARCVFLDSRCCVTLSKLHVQSTMLLLQQLPNMFIKNGWPGKGFDSSVGTVRDAQGTDTITP